MDFYHTLLVAQPACLIQVEIGAVLVLQGDNLTSDPTLADVDGAFSEVQMLTLW